MDGRVAVRAERNWQIADTKPWLSVSLDEISRVVNLGHCKGISGDPLYTTSLNFEEIKPTLRSYKPQVKVSVVNPVYHNLHIQLENYLEEYQINIYSIGGSKCLSMNVENRGDLIIDFSNYGQGMYILELVQNGKHLNSLKFVKN